MTVVRGVDGCRAGWICVALDVNRNEVVSADVYQSTEALFEDDEAAVTGIDIPIGLPDVHPRTCDSSARKALGKRGSSVFPVPVRAVLGANTYQEACDLSERQCGKRLPRQTYAILSKIRDVDGLLLGSADLRRRVYEVHPELSFCYLNDGDPMEHPKLSGFGFMERLELVEREFGDVAQRIRGELRRAHVADDDILDALAVAWTARRIHLKEAVRIPDGDEERDTRGLPMRMWA